MLEVDRNNVFALTDLAWSKLYAGSIEEVIPGLERAIRLSPRDRRIGLWYYRIGVVHLLQSRNDDALVCFEKARSTEPSAPFVYVHLASAYALKGETGHAAVELAEARRLVGDDRYSSITRLKAVRYFGVPKIRALFETTYFAGLRKAGMPEE